MTPASATVPPAAPVARPTRTPDARRSGFGRLPQALRTPQVMDVGIAVAVGAATVLMDTQGPDARVSAAVWWDLALAAPLIVRRRYPTVCLALVSVLCFGQWLQDVRASGPLAFLIALYTFSSSEVRRATMAAAVVVAGLGVALVMIRWAPSSQRPLHTLMFTAVVAAAWIAGVYARTRRAYLRATLERAETAERDRDRQAQIAIAADRAQMAREMHDVIAHSLSVMITLNDAAAAVASPEAMRTTVVQASDVGRQALSEMHRMLRVLREDAQADLFPQPGLAQLGDLVAMVRDAGLDVRLSITGDVRVLPATAQLAAYRIVQESLTNVLKHARSVQHVDVALTVGEDELRVQIEDDGARIDEHGRGRMGHGLQGMSERAALFGGTAVAGPSAPRGWTVRAVLHTDPMADPQ
ncbi:histidine kinase [Allobranchiibius sp. GilTou38]|uniref:sensor histidine kinase n=1 Tax=Allobranchiibius sp. GilTou38 TaxID=2815210 RepID=UPI001AA0FDF6|nr:histidine kinase [Allobranchiibius sp. GilTou38]MBO1765360.1 hypothetical protein [Allobranchiibius sp. GilTou38]